MRHVGFVVCLFGLWLTALTVEAQPEAESRDREARGLFDAGREAYGAGEFERALEYFQRAHELSGHPELLFNVAQAAERSRQDAIAIDAYTRFIEAMPDSPSRSVAENRLEFLRRQAATDEPATDATTDTPADEPAVDPVAPPDERSRETSDRAETDAPLLPWILIGGGGALAVTGGVFLVLGESSRASVEDAPQGSRWSDVSGDYDTAAPFGTIGTIGLITGVLAAGAGVAVWIASSSAEAETQVGIGPGTVFVRGRL